VAADVWFLIFDPQAEAMVCERWLGERAVRDRARLRLGMAGHASSGTEYWSDVDPAHVVAIAEGYFDEAATPDEVREHARRFPSPRFWWFVVDSF